MTESTHTSLSTALASVLAARLDGASRVALLQVVTRLAADPDRPAAEAVPTAAVIPFPRRPLASRNAPEPAA
jgi:hypothetical protein